MKISFESKRLNKKKIIILLPPWGAPSYIFLLAKKLIPNDFGYICCDYSKDILTSDPYEIKENILELVDLILTKLAKLNNKSFYIYAISLGTSIAMLLSDKINIKKEVLVVTGSDFAEALWYGKDTLYLRKDMEKKGWNLRKLKQVWREFKVSSFFKTKNKTKYLIKLAKKDKVIPYENGLNLIKFLKKQNIDFKLEEYQSISHKLACALEGVYPISSLEFLIGRNTEFTNNIKKYIERKNDVLEKLNSNIAKKKIVKTK